MNSKQFTYFCSINISCACYLYHVGCVIQSFTGRNVYGVLRAVRGASTESIVVSAPYRAPHSVHPSNTPAIALMLAMAHFFAGQ